MKKDLLFVIDSLACAGAEKSLITLLNLLDYSKYNVDLQLFTYGGEFEQFLPEQVNLLPPIPYTEFASQSIVKNLISLTSIEKIKWLYRRLRYSSYLRNETKKTHPLIAQKYWEFLQSCIAPNPKHYDCAIGYAQGVPTFYVVDKVSAEKKCGWVNVSLHLQGVMKEFQSSYYSKLDSIVTVSDSAYETFTEVYPELKDKMTIIWDIQDYGIISRMSQMAESYKDAYTGHRILTVGRLNNTQKGYDMALEACKLLKERGVNFRWYALGRGPFEEEMRSFIRENNLENHFVLLGTTSNPYPYFKDADVYVQTSRHEGYGLTIAEARMLNTPVVTTEFDAVYNQMKQGKNGLVVPQNPEKIADAIELLLNDSELYDSIVAFQKQEKKGNTEEIEKFYKLIES